MFTFEIYLLRYKFDIRKKKKEEKHRARISYVFQKGGKYINNTIYLAVKEKLPEFSLLILKTFPSKENIYLLLHRNEIGLKEYLKMTES